MSHTLLIFNELCLDCAKKVLFCVKEMATLKSQIKPARVSANKARLDGKKAKSAALPAAALESFAWKRKETRNSVAKKLADRAV